MDEEHIPATRHRLKRVDTYEITVGDFNRIKSEAGNVGTHLQFCIALIPLAISLWLTLATVPIPPDHTKTYYTILSLSVVFGSLGLFHGVCAFRQRGNFNRMMEDLRSLQTAPFGSEGNELKPADLAILPAQQAGPVQIPIEVSSSFQPSSDQS